MNLIKKLYIKIVDYGHNIINYIYRFYLLLRPFKIMNANDTINYIIKHKCSVARFGDGELSIAAYNDSIKFQKADIELKKMLNEVIANNNDRLLVCLPNRVNMNGFERKKLQPFWQESLKKNLYNWTKNFKKNRIYGDASFTRLAGIVEKEKKYNQILNIKKIWEGKIILLVEGDKTRFGVGNDLLDKAIKIYRILGPAEDAFDYYDELLSVILTTVNKINNSNIIILIALGPTATVLAAELAEHSIQAIDIGHLDICYEWLKQGDYGKINGKYTSEAVGGDNVENCFDEKYLSEIIYRYKEKIID